jgi:hypothetical protein
MKCYGCNDMFLDGEDYRDHLPCAGTVDDKLERAHTYIKHLEAAIKECAGDGGCRATNTLLERTFSLG